MLDDALDDVPENVEEELEEAENALDEPASPRTIEDDPAWPIYSVTATYDVEHPKNGKQEQSVNATRMFHNVLDDPLEKLRPWMVDEHIPNNREARLDDERPGTDPKWAPLYEPLGEVEVEVESWWFETWRLTWFSHVTFDVGQTDEEALRSFQRYVNRHRPYQRREPGERPTIDHPDVDRPIPAQTLMGAEDRWRWKGSEDGSTNYESRTDPPCRCEYCQEQEVIRVGH